MMYEVTSHSFSMQDGGAAASNGEGYCSGSSYYSADPSSTLLSAANSSYAPDVLLQPGSVVWNPPPTFIADDGDASGCIKQSGCYQQQDGSFDCQSSPSSSRYHGEAGCGGGHHPGKTVHSSAAAAAAVVEATAALRLATSTSMFGLKPSPHGQPGTFPGTALRGPTAEGIAVAARLAAGAAAAAADFAPTIASGYVQPGLATTSSSSYGSTTPSSFQLSTGSIIDDASNTSSLQSGLHGFHPAAACNGFIPTATGTPGAAYSAFQKLQSPWPAPRLTMDAYSSLDACKCLIFR